MAFPFYFLAFNLKSVLHKFEELDTKKKLLGTILFFISTLILLSLNGNGGINGICYGNDLLLFYLQGVLGSFFVCFISIIVVNVRKIRIIPYITTLGGATIVLLLFQPPFILLFRVIYKIITHPDHPAPYFDVIGGFFIASIIEVMMIPAIILIDKHIPILNGKVK
jgi:hypothetical protein